MIGVEYDLFWRLNPKSLTPFVKAFSMKAKYEDSLAWTMGMPSRPMVYNTKVYLNNQMTRVFRKHLLKIDGVYRSKKW